MTDGKTDEMLMTAVRRGGVVDLAPLFERHSRRLFGFLRGFVGCPSTAEDLVQETFMRILRYRRSYRPGQPFLPWLLGIGRNVAWAQLKTGARMPLAEMPELPDAGCAETDLFERERAGWLTRALELLPAGDREILLLSYFEGLRHRDIADLVESTPGAVKVRLHRARKALRRRLAQLEGRR